MAGSRPLLNSASAAFGTRKGLCIVPRRTQPNSPAAFHDQTNSSTPHRSRESVGTAGADAASTHACSRDSVLGPASTPGRPEHHVVRTAAILVLAPGGLGEDDAAVRQDRAEGRAGSRRQYARSAVGLTVNDLADRGPHPGWAVAVRAARLATSSWRCRASASRHRSGSPEPAGRPRSIPPRRRS